MTSGEIVRTLPNKGKMISSAYKGWIDPETSYQTGIAPTAGITKAKNASEALQMVRAMKNSKQALSTSKVFKPKPIKDLNESGLLFFKIR